jgi:NADPH:quinone reductase-like Zn-dependent oxidoreductase
VKPNSKLGAKVQEIMNNRGGDYILENGGSGTMAQSLEAIAVGGVIVVNGLLSAAAQSQMPDVAVLALGKGCVV